MAEANLDSFREQFLTCSICLEEFTQPRQLPCLHVFCHECLQEIISYRQPQVPGWMGGPGGPQTIKCPLCKKEHAVPLTGVNAFPHDFRTQSLLDLKIADTMGSPKSPSATAPMYPDLQQVPTAPPIHVLDTYADTDTKRKLEAHIQQHGRQLAMEKAKLQRITEGLDEINSTYDAVFQCIEKRERRILQQVRESSVKLKQGVTNGHNTSKRKFEDYVKSLKNKVRKMEEEALLAREVARSNSEGQLQQYMENSNLQSFNYPNNDSDELETWIAPNLLFKNNLVGDKEIEQYLSPVMGSMCTIEKDSAVTGDEYDVPSFLEADMSKPTFPFVRQKSSKAINVGRIFRWSSPGSFSGIAVLEENAVMCQYHDNSLLMCDVATGQPLWRSRKEEMGGFFKILNSLISSSQPSSAAAVTVQNTDYVAISYPHQFEIKLFKIENSHWRKELKEEAVAFHGDDVKPDKMCCTGDELIFLEYSGPAAQMGMYRRKLHVLNTTTIPFQHVRSVNPGFNIDSFCTLPSPAFNRLYFCVSDRTVVAIDSHGNQFWALGDLRARGICADRRGYLYVTSGQQDEPNGRPGLHVLWHDGTLLQTFSKAELNLVNPSQAVYDPKQRGLVIRDSPNHVSVIQIRYQ